MKILGRLLLGASLLSMGLLARDIYSNTRPGWEAGALAAVALLGGVLVGGRLVLWTLKDRTR